jgi:hypothetical protein
MKTYIVFRRTVSLFSFILALTPILARASDGSFIGSLNTITQVASTVPRNGDQNPYGVAVVPSSTGALVRGHILVSNFNNRKNLQGTGTTIMDIAPDGGTAVFAEIDAKRLPGPCPGGVGLTTALVVLSKGWVIVGSLPTTDGTAATAGAGCLLVLNSIGQVVETFSGSPVNGPWDMTALDGGDTAQLFVTNVLNGTVASNGNIVNQGTVVRILLSIPDSGVPAELSRTVIASGLPERTDPNALVIGPTGVGLSANGTLYVADTLGNRIAAITKAISRLTSAGTGTTVSSDGAINGPLGLAIAPNGDILTANGGDGNLVETTPNGKQVVIKGIDISGQGGGTLFGIAIAFGGTGVYFVDDGNNTLDVLE